MLAAFIGIRIYNLISKKFEIGFVFAVFNPCIVLTINSIYSNFCSEKWFFWQKKIKKNIINQFAKCVFFLEQILGIRMMQI